MRWLWLLAAVLLVSGCSDYTCQPCSDDESSLWHIEPDSMNVGVLLLDYQTYSLEGGNLSHYRSCGGCGADSLPFLVQVTEPMDFGGILFQHPTTGDSLFAATVIWMGTGRVLYPREFVPSDSFGVVCDGVPEPPDPERYDYFVFLSDDAMIAKTDSAWQAVQSLDIVDAFSQGDFRVGYFLYPRAVGMFAPGLAKWVVFLYRED